MKAKKNQPSLVALCELWKQIQAEKTRFIKRVNELEAQFRRQHKLKPKDASIIWLDELLIGIETRRGKQRVTLYDSDLK